MEKKILTEIPMFYGKVNMPENWDIDREKLSQEILNSNLLDKPFKFSKTFDILDTYIKDFAHAKHGLQIINKKTWGDIYKPKASSLPLLQVNPVDLKNSPDYVLLYGVKIEKDSCFIRIHYDDNRRKGKSWDIPLQNNYFVMFPATQMYFVSENISDELNFIQTITYEYI